MKTYKLFIRYWYGLLVEIVETDNLYEYIGKLYCTSLDRIERVDYKELVGGISACPYFESICACCSNRYVCVKFTKGGALNDS